MKRLYAILLFAFAVVVTSCRSTGTHTVVSGIEEAKSGEFGSDPVSTAHCLDQGEKTKLRIFVSGR